ncbi:MAG: hypothetical protein GY711_06925 [bacterium]|nr:hypothetical protein [bacterium]
MRPHDPKPRKHAAARAARTYLRNALGWLEGFPTGQEPGLVRWRAFGTLEPGGAPVDIEVDRERLRSSSHGLRGARRKFPRALARVVGDVDAWSAGVERRIELLKAAVHEGAPLPDARTLSALSGRTIDRMPPDLTAPLLWALWDRVEHWSEAQRRLAEWQLALAEVAARTGDARDLALEVALRPGPTEDLEPFRRMLGDRRTWLRPYEEGGFRAKLAATLKAIGRMLRGSGKKNEYSASSLTVGFLAPGVPRPQPRLAHELLTVLLRRPGEIDLRALGALLSATRLDEWDAWWRAAEDVERRVRSALGRAVLHDRVPNKDLARVATEGESWLAELAEPPAPWDFARARRTAAQFAARCDPSLAVQVLAAWEAVPDGSPLSKRSWRGSTHRELVARRWTHALQDGLGRKQAARLASAQLALLRTHASREAQRLVDAFTSVALEEASKMSGPKLDLLVATLGELGSRGTAGMNLLATVAAWEIQVEPFLAVTKEPVRCADLIQAWDGARAESGWPDERLLARLCGDDVFDTEFWTEGGKLDWDSAEYESLRRAARSDHARDLFHGLVKDGQRQRLREFARLHLAATALTPDGPSEEPPIQSASTDDFPWVPQELRDAARDLQAIDGPESLDRALRDDVMRPERIEAEVEALKERLPAADPRWAPHLAARLETLRRRMSQPPHLTPARVAACRTRIDRRTRMARLAAWERTLQGSLERHLPVGFAALQERTMPNMVSALAALRRAARDLAWHLIALRGTAAADLRDEPANAAWRRRMGARGLNLASWIDPAPGPEVLSPQGRILRFAFETDTLEIFQMGRWFGTCLSPGDFNFFSTVANAADLNKRVLVARDPRGKVQVRCLFALTRRGELLAFHVYAHEEGPWARAQVHTIAVELARSVGTRLVPEGEVETLVAPAWYDDGPIDLTGRLELFRANGPLVSAIRTAEPSRLPGLLEEELGVELLDSALDQIITHDVFAEEPARLVALGPLLHSRPLSGWAAVDIAQRVIDHDPDFARTMLLRFLRRRRGRGLDLHGGKLVELATALSKCGEPGRALRVLRNVEHTDADSEHAAVDALLALHRQGQAIRKLEGLAHGGDQRASKRLHDMAKPG